MAYLYIAHQHVDDWAGHNGIMRDDAEKAANPNHNNCYKEFTITSEQYEDLKMLRKKVKFNNSNELEWMDIEPETWNSLEEMNQYISDNFSSDPTDLGNTPFNQAQKAIYDAIKAIDWSSETFPLTGHFRDLCVAKGLSWEAKYW
jgi:hypothetical protein